MKSNKLHFATRTIHSGYDPHQNHGALTPPMHTSSTFAFNSVEQGGAAFAGDNDHYIYSRLGTPSQQQLEQRLADLEEAEAALVTASGMGAITSAIWSLVEPGDEIIADKSLYGCTFSFFEHGLKKFGVAVNYVDLSKPQFLSEHITDKTKLVYTESPSNPNMRLVDIAAVAKITQPRQIKFIVDNTFCTPYLQNPIALGADIAVHSATKYLGGHGDLIAGVVAGSAEDLLHIRQYGLKDMTGAVISGHDVALLMRGLKTLHVRMDRHCENAQKVAEHLQASPYVKQIDYPGLANFPQAELAKKQMRQPGGMLAFELNGSRHQAAEFVNRLELILCAVSLGDTESLIQHPASMTHSTYTEEELLAHLINPSLLRLSVGLEHVDDIIADINQALESVFNGGSGNSGLSALA